MNKTSFLPLVKAGALLGLLTANVGAAQMADSPVNPCKAEDAGKWQTADGGCKDVLTGKIWGAYLINPGGYPPTFTQAKQLCADYSVEGGYADWRLASKDEMLTAVSHGTAAHLNIPPGDYSFFSSTQAGSNFVYLVSLATGRVTKSRIYDPRGDVYTQAPAICIRPASP